MKEYWISLAEPPAQGADFVLEDAEIWDALAAESGCRVSRPLCAKVHVAPLREGFLAHGRLTGELYMPCSRCTEDAALRLDERFELFLGESVLAADGEAEGTILPEFEEDRSLRLEKGRPELDLAGLCGEEFVLALPVKLLCRPDCKGLCSGCGADMNAASCSCGERPGDLRLAALREWRRGSGTAK